MNTDTKNEVLMVIAGILVLGFLIGIHFFTKWVVGDGILETFVNLMILMFLSALVGLIPYVLINGTSRLIGKSFRVHWAICLIAMFVLFGIPNYYMSYKLKALKDEFNTRAKGDYSVNFTGEYNDGHPYNEADYGGTLDEVIAERTRIVMSNQFIPLGHAWKVTDGSSTIIGIYIYTFLPANTYNGIVRYFTCDTGENGEKEYAKYLEFLQTPQVREKTTTIPKPTPKPVALPPKTKVSQSAKPTYEKKP